LLYASPTTVRAYQLDRWIAPPPELFQQHLLAADLALAAPLTIRLLDFEQQFANPNAAHVVLRFVAEFGNTTGQAVTSREFRIQQATKTADAAGAVNAFAEAAKQATNSLGKWLAQVGHDDRLKPR
jgi:cholesterol transport system auxiliary component